MAEFNPRRLAIVLEDLCQELDRWALKSGDMVQTASYEMMQTQEQVEQVNRQSAIAQDNVLNERELVELQRNQLDGLIPSTREAKDNANRHIGEASKAVRLATDTLTSWKNELTKAQAWLQRAEERVRQAERDLASAQDTLRRAEAELAGARRALAACMAFRDPKGRPRNCSGPSARVTRAQQVVTTASRQVEIAKSELEDAKAERIRAQKRVRCCERAVEIAKEAVGMAQDALERANMAANASDRSQECATAADRFLTHSEHALTDMETETEELLNTALKARNLTDECQHHANNAIAMEESAARLNIMARADLLNRANHLYYLNRQSTIDGLGFNQAATSADTQTTLVLPTSGSRRAGDMVDKMIERTGKADLTLPGAWGRFAHNAVADYILDRDPDAEVEKVVAVIGEDGGVKKGRLDALTEGVIIDVKTHNLDKFSDNRLMKKLSDFATQIKGYQASPDISGKPDMAIFFEFRPKKNGRSDIVKEFFQKEGISVIWGND